MSKIADNVMNLVAPIAQTMGLEVVEVVYERKFDGMHLTVFIDRDGGINIEDCERLHRAIDEPLDKLDPIDCQYTLNVSSLGLDRPIKTDKDYERNLGKAITVKLYKPDADNKKKYNGILVGYDSNSFVIDSDGVLNSFDRQQVAHVELYIEF